MDHAGEYHSNLTTSITVVDFGSQTDSVVTKVNSKTVAMGGGLHLDIGFYITRRLIIGTETNYYFLRSKEKENILVTEIVTNEFSGFTSTAISNFNDETKVSEFALTVPVALYLIVKF